MNLLPAKHTRRELAVIEEASSSFFAIAQEDLEASKVLFEKKMYRPAVLLLQQAIEKAVKSLALETGIIELDDLKQLGHKPQKLYTELIIQLSNSLNKNLEDAETQSELQAVLEIIGEDTRNLADGYMEIKTIALKIAAKYDKCNLSEEELFKLLNLFDLLIQDLYELEQDILGNLGKKEYNETLFEWTTAIKIGFFLMPLNLDEKKKVNKNIDKIIQQLNSFSEFFESLFMLIMSEITASISLFFLSLLTAPHAMVSRYPYATDEEINPIEFYTDETPLIANFEEIYLYADYTFDRLELFYSVMTYLPDIHREAFRKKKAAPRLKKENRALKGGNET